MRTCKAPKIPPLFLDKLFVLNFKENAKPFTEFFHSNVNLLLLTVFCPTLVTWTNTTIEQIPTVNEDIISLISKLNPNKGNGSDGISGNMLLLCDDSVTFPLGIVFSNIPATALYPDMYKTC